MNTEHRNTEPMNEPAMEALLKEVSMLQVPRSSRSKEEAWSMLLQTIREEEGVEPKATKFFTARVWYSVAASIALLLAASWIFLMFSTVEVATPKGKTATILLPDKSELTLNADSRVKYPKLFEMGKREVVLEGEAYFKVQNGNNFTVSDLEGRTIVVTGTEFNVLTRADRFAVECFEGAVTVKTKSAGPVKLGKGTRVVEENRTLTTSTFEVGSNSKSAWINGEFYFNNSSLMTVFQEVERQFNVKIAVDGFDPQERTYTGYFTNTNLAAALDLVCLPMNLQYIIAPDSTSVHIYSRTE